MIWEGSAKVGYQTKFAYSFGNVLHVPNHEVVAFWVVEDGKAPGIFEGDQVRLLGVEVKVDCPKASNLFARHWRAVYALLKVWREY